MPMGIEVGVHGPEHKRAIQFIKTNQDTAIGQSLPLQHKIWLETMCIECVGKTKKWDTFRPDSQSRITQKFECRFKNRRCVNKAYVSKFLHTPGYTLFPRPLSWSDMRPHRANTSK